jgi:putative transposase
MPRRPRRDNTSSFYHVINRSVRRAPLFENDSEYFVFERVLLQALQRSVVRLLAYCAMPNHWHLVVRCSDIADLSAFMHWLTGTHAKRWHARHGTSGTGPVYQGRFKSVSIDSDRQFLTVCRYVERNALSGGLVARAEQWRWSSVWRRCNNCHAELLCDWPIPVPDWWLEHLNQE